MKATGIVRRIDDLGRVVIPKEIRRTLRIREGDPLEIFTERDGGIMLRKYSPISELSDFARDFSVAIEAITEKNTVICDKDGVICAAGNRKKDYTGKMLSKQLERLMIAGIFGAKLITESGFIQIFEDEDITMFTSQILQPIVMEGQLIGMVILSTKEGEAKLTDSDKAAAGVAATFLGHQMSQ